MALKITARTAKSAEGPAPGKSQVIHYDESLPGFGLRVTAAGAKSLILNFRAKKRERRITLDSIRDEATLEETDGIIARARRKAASIKSGARYEGVDPMEERHVERAQWTVADLSARFIEKHLPKKRSAENQKHIINTHILPALRHVRVADVRFEDVDGLHAKITKSGSPIQANRTIALFSKMLSEAIKLRLRTDNPARGIERNPENKRERYLKPEEITSLEAALKKRPGPLANAIRLLLLTGARRGEVLGATWSQFDLDSGTWTKPASSTKQEKEHKIPLADDAVDILVQMRADAEATAKKTNADVGEHVFVAKAGRAKREPKENDRARPELKKFWAEICKEAKITGVRIHDLRHTHASILANSGQTLLDIGALLGHSSPVTTARYSHLFDDRLRRATNAAAASISGVKPRKTAKIVPLRPRRLRRPSRHG